MVASHKKFKDTLKFIEKTGGQVSLKRVEKKKKAVVAKSKIAMIDLKKSITTSPKKKSATKTETK